jgi:3-oxoacyl-[acyl-carrier protein] reductase
MASAVALITGAGRGIGQAAAVEMARRGYRLALLSRTPDQLRQTCQLAMKRGLDEADVLELTVDVRQADQVEAGIAGIAGRFGRLDAIIHCAGLAPALAVEQMSVEAWHEVLDTNLSSAFYLARSAWPIFRRQGAGVMVNISSMSSRDPFPGFAAYGAAKAGLNILSLVLAREGAAIGVRVHTIAPGAVETEMFRGLASEAQWPAEKTLCPADVADMIARCVSGELRYTSGEVIFLSRTVPGA